MSTYEIPLNSGNQKFNIQLNGVLYKLKFIFRLDGWYLDLLDTAENPLISGLSMSAGIDLLEQHQHIIKGSLYVSNNNIGETQSFNDLGLKIKLYWEDPE